MTHDERVDRILAGFRKRGENMLIKGAWDAHGHHVWECIRCGHIFRDANAVHRWVRDHMALETDRCPHCPKPGGEVE